jgi:hypothetical protein
MWNPLTWQMVRFVPEINVFLVNAFSAYHHECLLTHMQLSKQIYILLVGWILYLVT